MPSESGYEVESSGLAHTSSQPHPRTPARSGPVPSTRLRSSTVRVLPDLPEDQTRFAASGSVSGDWRQGGSGPSVLEPDVNRGRSSLAEWSNAEAHGVRVSSASARTSSATSSRPPLAPNWEVRETVQFPPSTSAAPASSARAEAGRLASSSRSSSSLATGGDPQSSQSRHTYQSMGEFLPEAPASLAHVGSFSHGMAGDRRFTSTAPDPAFSTGLASASATTPSFQSPPYPPHPSSYAAPQMPTSLLPPNYASYPASEIPQAVYSRNQPSLATPLGGTVHAPDYEMQQYARETPPLPYQPPPMNIEQPYQPIGGYPFYSDQNLDSGGPFPQPVGGEFGRPPHPRPSVYHSNRSGGSNDSSGTGQYPTEELWYSLSSRPPDEDMDTADQAGT